jgi:hypothetical protein
MFQSCSFPDCIDTTNHPKRDGWSWLEALGPDMLDGYYCPEHAEFLEELYGEDGSEAEQPYR